jgi:hypothetical protein
MSGVAWGFAAVIDWIMTANVSAKRLKIPGPSIYVSNIPILIFTVYKLT